MEIILLGILILISIAIFFKKPKKEQIILKNFY